MKRIENYIGHAKKIQGVGDVDYYLWIDNNGDLFVQSCGNEMSGTYSNLLFSVSQHAAKRNSDAAIRHPTGYNLTDSNFKNSDNNNDDAFLKAVLRDLLP